MINEKGEKIRGKLKGLTLSEVSLVDYGANKLAKVTLFKRGKPDVRTAAGEVLRVAKYYDTISKPGARTFEELRADAEERERRWKVQQKLCPIFDAITDSLRSIASDTSLTDASRLAMARTSVQAFMEAIAEELPGVQEEVQKLLVTQDAALAALFAGAAGTDGTGDDDMAGEKTNTDLQKRLDDAEKANGELTTQLKAATDQVTALTDQVAKADAKVKELEGQVDVAKSDETFEQNGKTIRKSVVGAEVFDFIKAQHETIELAKFEKMAEGNEYGALPGTPVAKAKALRAISKIADKEAREAAEAMLKAGNTAVDEAMDEEGDTGGEGDEGGSSTARTKFNAGVSAMMKADPKLSKRSAEAKFAQTKEGAALYAEMEQDGEA